MLQTYIFGQHNQLIWSELFFLVKDRILVILAEGICFSDRNFCMNFWRIPMPSAFSNEKVEKWSHSAKKYYKLKLCITIGCWTFQPKACVRNFSTPSFNHRLFNYSRIPGFSHGVEKYVVEALVLKVRPPLESRHFNPGLFKHLWKVCGWNLGMKSLTISRFRTFQSSIPDLENVTFGINMLLGNH